MDTEKIGPATPPDEAALSFYKEAMVAWRNGDQEGMQEFLGIAPNCATISLAIKAVRVPMSIALAEMTPERAFEMYHSNIEDFDQGAPMMMAEELNGDLSIFQIIGIDVRDALRAMANEGERYRAVLLSNEARMWVYDSDGNSKTEGAVDAAVFTYRDQTGKTWAAVRQFVRFAEGNVRWISDLEEMPSDAAGAIPEGLARLVSADI